MCFLDLQPALSTSFAVQQRTTRPVRRPLDAVLRAAPECSTQSRWVYIDTCMSPHRHTLIKRIGHESSTFVSVDPFQTPISSPAYVLKLLICSASELRPRVATKSSQLDRRPPHLKPTPPVGVRCTQKQDLPADRAATIAPATIRPLLCATGSSSCHQAYLNPFLPPHRVRPISGCSCTGRS